MNEQTKIEQFTQQNITDASWSTLVCILVFALFILAIWAYRLRLNYKIDRNFSEKKIRELCELNIELLDENSRLKKAASTYTSK